MYGEMAVDYLFLPVSSTAFVVRKGKVRGGLILIMVSKVLRVHCVRRERGEHMGGTESLKNI